MDNSDCKVVAQDKRVVVDSLETEVGKKEVPRRLCVAPVAFGDAEVLEQRGDGLRENLLSLSMLLLPETC